MTDREKFLSQAKTYIGQTGYGVCIQKLKIGFIVDWCAFSVSAIMNDCDFVGKYIKAIEGGAGTIPRYSDGKYGDWFKKGTRAPQAGDLFFLRYADYPYQDKYFCDHVGIVESVNGNVITTLEGNVDGVSGNWAATSTFKRKTRYLNDYTVYAFYRPRWSDNSTSDTTDKQESVTPSKPSAPTNEVYNADSAAKVNYTVKVTASDGLNLRVGPATSYSKIGAVPCGEKLTITRQTSGGGYSWGLTVYGSKNGWVALNYTQKVTDKTIDELAREVILGLWSSGSERERLLHQAGYDYQAVQKRVNEILK